MAKVKRGLGKGLDALIPQEEFLIGNSIAEIDRENVFEIDVNKIFPNKSQPRKVFDKDKLKALEDSIEEHGIIQPILLRKVNKEFEIVAGERRWRAAKNLNLKVVPAVIKELSDKDVSEIALIENLQREDLNDIEEALAYKVLLDEYFITHEKLSKIVGKSRSYISNTIRLLKLDEKTTKFITEGNISGGHGRALLPIEKIEDRHKIIDDIIARSLSVRDVEKIVSNFNKQEPKKIKSISKNENILEIEEKISEFLGTKASIKLGKSKNKIEIEYYNNNDLDRILEILKI